MAYKGPLIEDSHLVIVELDLDLVCRAEKSSRYLSLDKIPFWHTSATLDCMKYLIDADKNLLVRRFSSRHFCPHV